VESVAVVQLSPDAQLEIAVQLLVLVLLPTQLELPATQAAETYSPAPGREQLAREVLLPRAIGSPEAQMAVT